MRPKISVVMAVYNSMPYLKDSVISILSQTFRDFEFIIIDDYSVDGSFEYLRNCRDSRIMLFRNGRNVGLTRSLNRAMEHVTAPIVARMDADDISELYRLKVQFDYMKKDSVLTLLGSDAYIINDKSKCIKVKRRLKNNREIKFYTLLNNPFMHTSVMFYKSCYDKLGGYNNQIQYAQDYDLWARWVRLFKAENINEILVRWRQNSKGISTTKTSLQMVSADKTCVRYVRSVFPELYFIPDIDIVSMRNGRYTRDNINSIHFILNSVMRDFKCEYVVNWISHFKVRTQYLT